MSRDGRRNFQAWLPDETFETLTSWFKGQGISATAWLEAVAEWLGEHEGVLEGSAGWVVMRARVITAERRGRGAR